ncbi:sn-glycerol-3-phosphate ABC transporter ATP-binding protein UgpC [Arsenicitalea aurantiaca]|uniref:sn-glycerol-3-phosphate ABC transporter ATP-binding protein UgpC n=1 Tax=Arsenicitalea aurantiaca TaxID=1783274 RepID=A0A433XAF7_9HYPH|nr:sn-glycerol-3-phosphate ABC transporter ATP-binding protein UgpC [Arsenicitalea aurantiaca]RUT31066.1 sn-glycerol-3-phosphate ABC transporter ATP-binding protein UgpC [Arsenicitalea aurantiaca]
MSSLTVRNLRKNFGMVEVLKGVDLEAKTGEFIALVGPSGCGKSTLLAMIAGLESVSSGEIWIEDRLVNSVAPKDRDIAMVFQSYALYPTMTVRQNMLFGMESRGVPKAEQVEAIKRVAALLQIEPLLERKPGQLSGGQRQRVAMGRALVRDPKLFLFDEPLSNLDAKLRVDMRTEIKKLHHRVGKTTIYVTHDQVEAMTLASRIAVMHQGEVQQFADPDTIYNRPANMFVAGFMGSPAMNFIPARFTETGGPALALSGAPSAAPLGVAPAHAASVAPGRQVVLGVRPEHLCRYALQTEERKANLARLTVPVEVVEPTGAETMAVMRLGEQEIVGRFNPDEAPRMGEEIELGVDMTRACLFDPETRRLI